MAADEPRLIFRSHAIERMVERAITLSDVRFVVARGEVIQERIDDLPTASKLVLGFPNGRPIHVVVAETASLMEMVIVTAYEPDRLLWEPGFRRRRS